MTQRVDTFAALLFYFGLFIFLALAPKEYRHRGAVRPDAAHPGQRRFAGRLIPRPGACRAHWHLD